MHDTRIETLCINNCAAYHIYETCMDIPYYLHIRDHYHAKTILSKFRENLERKKLSKCRISFRYGYRPSLILNKRKKLAHKN